MAGVSTKEIKGRIRSMESTKQITKAMEMVAASKLRHAQAQVLSSRPYFQTFHDTINDILDSNRDFTSPYLVKHESGRTLYVVIAGDRGLAGGYNSNVLKMVTAEIGEQDVEIMPIGKKALDYFKSHGYTLLTESYAIAADISISDCFSISKEIAKRFLSGEFNEVRVAYTDFVSVLQQNPNSMQLLPLTRGQRKERDQEKMPSRGIIYEPDSEEVFASIVPEYLGGILYGSLCESRAAEQAARRTAMDSATSNAEDMIADLNLKFNRARQSAITQEITEIVAGS